MLMSNWLVSASFEYAMCTYICMHISVFILFMLAGNASALSPFLSRYILLL